MTTTPSTPSPSTPTPSPVTDTSGRTRVLHLLLCALLGLLGVGCGSSVLVGDGSPGEPVDVGQPMPRQATGPTAPAPFRDVPIEPDIVLGDGVGLAPSAATTVVDNGDGTTELVGTVEIPTAGGTIVIEDADLVVETDPVTGEDRIVGGTGRVPFPQMGDLAGAVVHHLPIATIGVARGHELHHLGAHLLDDREYFFFHFDAGLEVELPFAGRPGYESLPLDLVVPAGTSATFVLDPTDPYFYLGGSCPQDTDDAERSGDSSQRAGEPADRTEASDADAADRTDREDALVGLEASDLPPGEDCGFGFSLGGNIPAPATAGGGTFGGHVVVDGIVPLYAGIELDGTIVAAIDEGLRVVGRGDIVTAIPLAPGVLDVAIPLGDASVELRSDVHRIGVAIEGTVGAAERVQLPLDIPVTLPNSGRVDFVASYGFVPGADGSAVLDPASYAEITGEAQLGLAQYGRLLGLDLSDLATTEATLRIDPAGARFTGRGTLGVHRDLGTGSTTTIDAFISTTDATATHLTGTATLDVLGTEVADASLRLDHTGLSISGRIRAGGSDVDVAGRVTEHGVELTGRASVAVTVGGFDTGRAQTRITEALAEIERLDSEIEATRAIVRNEVRDRDETLENARRALGAAETELDRINDTIRDNNRPIDRLEERKDDEKERFADLRLSQQAVQLVAHESRLAGWTAEIVALEASNVTQAGLKTAAEAAVRTAQDALDAAEAALDAIPIDADPRIAVLVTARDAAQVTLESLRSGAEASSRGGTVRGTVDVRLGATGLGGSFAGEFCGTSDTNCVPIVGGTVQYSPSPILCVDLPAVGEQCITL